MNELIEIHLSDMQMSLLQMHGHVKANPLNDKYIKLGGVILPRKFVRLYCEDEDRLKYPRIYEQKEDIDGEFIGFTDEGWSLQCEAYSARWVSGYWTASHQHWLHVFVDEKACQSWLENQKNTGDFTIRAADGSAREVKLAVRFMDPS